MERPVCKCHGEAMYRNSSRGGWRCAVRHERRERVYYEARPAEWFVRRALRETQRQRRLAELREAV